MSGAAEIVAQLRARRSPRNIAGQRSFGITPRNEQLGISVTELRKIARVHHRNHRLALELWDTGVHDARVLATIVEDPRAVSRSQMDRWVRDADNWALSDELAFLFDRTAFAEAKAHAWSARRAEFVKRAGFALMAGMAVHRKELPDEVFLRLLRVIAREAADERNFVKKAVSWALRQIGKRNPRLCCAAIAEARRIQKFDSRSARWIAAEALRELRARPTGGRNR